MSQREFSEEELRALEREMDKVTVDDVLLQTIVTLINLGARKGGLAPRPGGAESEPSQADMEQFRQAIEGARALLPLVEQRHADKIGPVRDSLAQLQMAYAQKAGAGAPPPEAQPGAAPPKGEPEGPRPGEPGPAQRSGRLWVPGQ